MSLSSETVISVVIGGLISGVITWVVAHLYFRKQDTRVEQVFEVIIRTIQRLVLAVESEAQTYFQVIRDDKGRIADVRVTIFQGHAPTVDTTKADDTRTESGQTDDLMS
jgi:hypothetical protein